MGLPIPDLDNKTFDELVAEAHLLIPRFDREWTDHNPSDPGITLIELLAWLTEMQIYQLNRVTEADEREFLKLAGIHPFAVQPAQTEVTFQEIPAVMALEAATPVLTTVGGESIGFETEAELTLIPVNLISVLTIYGSAIIDQTKANEREETAFFAFGTTASLQAELRMGFDQPFPATAMIQITFRLFEADLPAVRSPETEATPVVPSARVAWEYLNGDKWEALVIQADHTRALTRSGRLIFSGPEVMGRKDNLYWIRCRLLQGIYEIAPRINQILLNTVSVVQLETIGEGLELESGRPEALLKLSRSPVIPDSLMVLVREGGTEWLHGQKVIDFELSGPDDLHYRFDPGSGEIYFGNGLNGRIPSSTAEIRVSYRTTLGPKGNLPAGQGWRIQKAGFEKIRGQNGTAASGGQTAESLEAAKDRARRDWRTVYRAITVSDYEQLAIATPGLRVARAKALPGYTSHCPQVVLPGAMTVVVVPYNRAGAGRELPIPGAGFLQTVWRQLDRHRLITTDLDVVGPEYVRVTVHCQARIKQLESPVEVGQRIRNTLQQFLDPITGGVDGYGWPFGRTVYPGELYALLDQVAGVDYVETVSLEAEGSYSPEGGMIKISPVALVCSGAHQVEIIS